MHATNKYSKVNEYYQVSKKKNLLFYMRVDVIKWKFVLAEEFASTRSIEQLKEEAS